MITCESRAPLVMTLSYTDIQRKSASSRNRLHSERLQDQPLHGVRWEIIHLPLSSASRIDSLFRFDSCCSHNADPVVLILEVRGEARSLLRLASS
jgi:hypothetical protein